MLSQPNSSGAAPRQSVLSVSQLTGVIKDLLEAAIPHVWVSGEILDISRPRSGHVYFTLKDDRAQLRCVMWRNTAQRLRFDLDDGMQVICQGGVDVYPPRGGYQLIVREVEPLGVGAQQLALRKLRDRLAAEGLFAAERKRPLPRFPRRVAFVTSPTSAAVNDFLEVARRRWRGVSVLIAPTRVQGEGAAQEIAAQIRNVNRWKDEIDILIVGRGGGSLEDLWCFNEEPVVRAIAESSIPVVSAVGHEIDVTLSDLAADVRALTPSEAAELATPSSEEILASLQATEQRLLAALRRRYDEARRRLELLGRQRVFRQPLERIQLYSARLDELEGRLARAARVGLERGDMQLAAAAERLASLSPLATLGRGYSLTTWADSGELVRNVSEVANGVLLHTQLAEGAVVSRVEEVHAGAAPLAKRPDAKDRE